MIKRGFIIFLVLTLFTSMSCTSNDSTYHGVSRRANSGFGLYQCDQSFGWYSFGLFAPDKKIISLSLNSNAVAFVSRTFVNRNIIDEIGIKKGAEEILLLSKKGDADNYPEIIHLEGEQLYYSFHNSLSRIFVFNTRSQEIEQIIELPTEVGADTSDIKIFRGQIIYSTNEDIQKTSVYNYEDNTLETIEFKLIDLDYSSGNILASDTNGIFFADSLVADDRKYILLEKEPGYDFYSAFILDDGRLLLGFRKLKKDLVANFLFSNRNEYQIPYFQYFLYEKKEGIWQKERKLKSIKKHDELLSIEPEKN